MKAPLCEILGIEYPIIMAPMFLVTNVEMMVAADQAGISGCIPALNFRTIEEFEKALKELKEKCKNPIGINLIVNKSNPFYKQQLEKLVEYEVGYVITSLGNPKEVIEKCHKKNIKVFCDVVDLDYAKKCESLGADALIAVNSGAGGHAGKIPASILIPSLKENCNLPIISAGGVGSPEGLKSVLELGAAGVSVGSPFIATHESGVSKEYKQACVDYGAKDIVMSKKLSGTPCTVINTPYVEKIGTEPNPIEGFLNSHKKLKKYMKMLTFYKGTKLLEKAAFSATYKTVWCAGPSIEFVDEIQSVKEVVETIVGNK